MNATRSLTLTLALTTLAIAGTLAPNVESKPIFERKVALDTSTKSGKKLSAAIGTMIAQRELIQPLGVVVANIHDFAPELRQTAKAQLNMGDRLQIIHIAKDSIAERLGLEVGDQLIQFNDLYVSRGQKALEKLNVGVLPRIQWNQELSATIIRNGYGQTHSIDPNESFADARTPEPQDS